MTKRLLEEARDYILEQNRLCRLKTLRADFYNSIYTLSQKFPNPHLKIYQEAVRNTIEHQRPKILEINKEILKQQFTNNVFSEQESFLVDKLVEKYFDYFTKCSNLVKSEDYLTYREVYSFIFRTTMQRKAELYKLGNS
jgi:hypothetical protein